MNNHEKHSNEPTTHLWSTDTLACSTEGIMTLVKPTAFWRLKCQQPVAQHSGKIIIKEMEVVKGVKGEVGTVTKYVFVKDGEESEITETIRAIEDEAFVEMDFAMEGVMNMDYRVDFLE